ncbi:hypothetical protein P153DRAFT_226037 [Dothidotthia symphoricarpi CBS 119687]|uniref:C2H2-type domain-containing protein n=1 Tax=Dothidotthia symphoricarpi CBS 119687 TaxID=1392245 RepID=A0A6A6AFQ4_9PLEO|nr:uncharacterized protein P153DRAFT_226037 [Dothidotthia symphoricarpi CBS 119687]KAF2129878.1 hypothetical protein P153DRAFT_226037 [Dothidotthia symphoricarpi CBS 119687]
MRMSYYSPEADLVLLTPDESLGHMYPSSTCQSPPSIMYSPPLHHLTHPMPTAIPRTESMYSQHHNYTTVMDSPYPPPHTLWSSQPSPILQPRPQSSSYSYPPFTGMMPASTIAHDSSLLPQSFIESRSSRSHSASSSAGLGIPLFPASETSPPPLSRSLSPTSPDLRAYGFPNQNGTWSCAYPGCTSRALFTRGCDLRKHHKRHTKSFFCRHAECPQSSGGGFSSKKDLARHEAKHNPGVSCEWGSCDRVFSRVDNMRDHVKRIHLKASRKSSVASS